TIADSGTLNRVAEVACGFDARGYVPSRLYTKAAPIARRIFDHRCKRTFATVSASHAKESHLRVLLKPCVNLSIHPASDVRQPTLKHRQWGKSVGLARRTRANHCLAPLERPRRRLNFRLARRIR